MSDDTLWEAHGKPLTGLGKGKYRLTKDYLYFEKGLLGTKAEQIRTRNIFDIDLGQTLAQRARGVGTITLWVHRENGTSEQKLLEDVPGFREGVALLNEVCDVARHEHLQASNTSNVNYTGAVPVAGSAAAADPIEQLAKLADLHSAGALSDAEFTAAKAKLLGL